MLRAITIPRACALAAGLSGIVGICCVFVLWSAPAGATPAVLQIFCERLLRPGEVLTAALLPAEYGQIICESTPPPHARLVAVSAAVVLNSVFWTVLVAAILFIARLIRRPRHGTSSI
jgi:hypothetical protein